MSERQIKVGILGFGIVGCGTYRVLTENADEITRRAGAPVTVTAVADIDWSRERDIDVPPYVRSTDGMAVCTSPDIDIVVETIGGVGIAR